MGLALLDTAGEAGVPVIGLVLALGTAEGDLLTVDDDDIIAAIHGRSEGWLVLAAQAIGNDSGQTANDQTFGVDQHPILRDVLGFRRIGFHMDYSGLLRHKKKAQGTLRPFRLLGD